MTPRPILTGRVVDADGDPVADVEVQAENANGSTTTWRRPGNITRTDIHGRFRFYDLDPGSYHLVTSSPPNAGIWSGTYFGGDGEPLRSHQIETYYPAAVRVEGAVSIDLKAGREVTDITITMQTAVLRHVAGRVVGMSGGYMMLHIDLPNEASEGPAVQVGKDGTFRRDGLRAGIYTLRLPGGLTKTIDLTNGDADNLLIETGEPHR